MIDIELIIGIIIGFFIFEVFSGRKEGKIGNSILILETKKYDYHLHHWMIFLLILIILLAIEYHNDFIYGLVIGIIVHGLTYKDFYEIRTKPKK